MRIGEFVEAVESYGVKPILTATGSLGNFYEDIIGVDHPGTGHTRDYTTRHVRRLVSWFRIGAIVGGVAAPGNQRQSSSSAQQRSQAMRLLAAAPSGYVVMANGRAWWSYTEPVATLRSMCAVVVPVPEWRH